MLWEALVRTIAPLVHSVYTAFTGSELASVKIKKINGVNQGTWELAS
jgi:hypothetical protein